MSLYDVPSVKALVDESLASSGGNPESSRDIFLENLMDWSDHYNENYSGDVNSEEARDARENIARLWIEYCNLEKSLKQFKKCVQVYEDALKEPIASKCIDLYISYADFCIERNKKSNAQKTFIRGLCAGLTVVDTDILWSKFLKFIHELNGSTSLTVADIYEAAKTQLKDVEGSLMAPSINYESHISDGHKIIKQEGSSEEVRIKEESHNVSLQSKNDQPSEQVRESHILPVGIIKSEDVSLTEQVPMEGMMRYNNIRDHSNMEAAEAKTSDDEVTMKMEEMVRLTAEENIVEDTATAMKDTVPQQPVFVEYFSPPHSPVPNESEDASSQISTREDRSDVVQAADELDDLSSLTPELLMRMYSQRPPMLFCGVDQMPLSLGFATLSQDEVVDMETFLNMPISNLSSSSSSSDLGSMVTCYLDLLESMWMSQALKERQFDAWFAALRNNHRNEELELQRNLDIAKSTNNLEGISCLETDLKRFKNRSFVQRELLHAVVNKIMYNILLDQERALIHVGFPLFTSDVVLKLENCLNNSKLSIGSNINQSVFDHEPQLERTILRQRVFVCALLSVRLNYLNNSELNRRLDVDIGNFKRMSSVESDISGDWTFEDDQRDRRSRKRQILDSSGSARANASGGYTIAPTLTGFSSIASVHHATQLPIQPQQQPFTILPPVSSVSSVPMKAGVASWSGGIPRKVESPQPYNPLFPYATAGRGQGRPATNLQRSNTGHESTVLLVGHSTGDTNANTSTGTGNLNKLSSMIQNINKNR